MSEKDYAATLVIESDPKIYVEGVLTADIRPRTGRAIDGGTKNGWKEKIPGPGRLFMQNDRPFKADAAEIKKALNLTLESMSIRYQYKGEERDEPVSIKEGADDAECLVSLEY